MPNLLGTKSDATSVPLILKRHGDNAVAFAEDVKAGSTIPNSTNNDLDAWITYLASNSGGSGITVVSTLPTDLSSYSVGDAIILSDQDGDNAKGVYIVAADSSDVYYQGRIRHYDSNGDRIISSFDPNPQNSLTFLEWYSNGYGDHRGQILLGIKSKLFDSRPNHIYLRVTHKNGDELDSSIDITFSHNGNQSLGIWIYWTTNTGIADNFDTGDTMRFSLYSDVGFQNALVPRSNKFWEDVAIDFGEGGSLVELIQSIEQLANANKLEADTNRSLIDQLQGESQGDLNWIALSRVEIDAGVGYFQQDSNTTESVYDSEFTTISQQIGSGQYRFYLRVPRDVDPTKYRIENVNASDNSLIRALPGSGQEWHEMTTVRNASSAYKYYRLYSTDTSLVQRVINQQIGNNTGIRLRSATRVGALAIPLGALAQSGATAGQVPQWNATDNEWEAGTIESAARGALSLTQIGSTLTLSSSVAVNTGIAVSDLSDAFYMNFVYATGSASSLNFTTLVLKSQIGASSSNPTRIQFQGGGSSFIGIYRSNGNLFFTRLPTTYNQATVRIFNTLAGARGESGAVTDLGEVIHVVDSLPAAPFTGYSPGQQIEVDGTIYELSSADANEVRGIASDVDYSDGLHAYRRDLGIVGYGNFIIHSSGHFTHNPVGSDEHPIIGGVQFIIDQYGSETISVGLVVYVNKAAYETAKGSATAANDRLLSVIAYEDSSNSNNNLTSQIVLYRESIRSYDGVDYISFYQDIDGIFGTRNSGETDKDVVTRLIASLRVTYPQYWNGITAMARSSANNTELSLFFYAETVTQDATKRITGLDRTGWTPKFSTLALENKSLSSRNRKDVEENTKKLNNLVSSGGSITLLQDNVHDVDEKIRDLSLPSSPNWGKVDTVATSDADKNKPAIANLSAQSYPQFATGTALSLARSLPNASWKDQHDTYGANGHIIVRLPRGTNDRTEQADQYRIKVTHSDSTVTYIAVSSLWNAGNNTSPNVKYYTSADYLVGSGITRIELEYIQSLSHVGQTEFSGKFDGSFKSSAGTDLSGAIVILTNSQYQNLSNDQKNNGKLYLISDQNRFRFMNQRVN